MGPLGPHISCDKKRKQSITTARMILRLLVSRFLESQLPNEMIKKGCFKAHFGQFRTWPT